MVANHFVKPPVKHRNSVSCRAFNFGMVQRSTRDSPVPGNELTVERRFQDVHFEHIRGFSQETLGLDACRLLRTFKSK